MAPWLRFLEAYMVQALLRTPAFHRAVEKVAKSVHRFRHGLPPEEMGGTKIDQPGESGFTKHFLDELRTQIGYAERQEAKGMTRNGNVKDASVDARAQKSNVSEEEGADAAWQNAQKTSSEAPKGGFMGEYLDALREQVRSSKGGK